MANKMRFLHIDAMSSQRFPRDDLCCTYWLKFLKAANFRTFIFILEMFALILSTLRQRSTVIRTLHLWFITLCVSRWDLKLCRVLSFCVKLMSLFDFKLFLVFMSLANQLKKCVCGAGAWIGPSNCKAFNQVCVTRVVKAHTAVPTVLIAD